MILNFITDIIILILSRLYPIFATFKILKNKSHKDYLRWMKYWIVFAIYSFIELFTGIFLSWFPFYNEVKIILIVWMLPPFGNGAQFLYKNLITNYISKHEEVIDDYLDRVHKHLSVDIFKSILVGIFTYIREKKRFAYNDPVLLYPFEDPLLDHHEYENTSADDDMFKFNEFMQPMDIEVPKLSSRKVRKSSRIRK